VSAALTEEYRAELEVMRGLDHPNIIAALGAWCARCGPNENCTGFGPNCETCPITLTENSD
jgi:hypothetical protein